MSEESEKKVLRVAVEWAKRARAIPPAARYPEDNALIKAVDEHLHVKAVVTFGVAPGSAETEIDPTIEPTPKPPKGRRHYRY